MLFLHDGGQTGRAWDFVRLALRGDFRCLALDQRVHGDSEWSYAFHRAPESHSGDIAGLLAALRIERAAIAGMSIRAWGTS